MNVHKKRNRIILAILLTATLCFIWGSSMQSRADSAEASNHFLLIIAKIAGKIGISVDTSDDHFLRKLAHVAEYAALGAELILITINENKFSGQRAVNCAGLGLLCAVTDETIQIFSQRGSMVGDVWIDLAGTALGIAFVCVCRVCILQSDDR